MNQLTKVFEGNQIRIAGTEKAPFFMVKDVCNALGLTNPSKVSGRIRNKYKANFSLGLSGSNPVFVSEAGLYQIIMRADQNEVTERFQDWVYEDVLPSIRQTGNYQLPQEMPFAELFRATATLLEQQQTQEVAVAELSQDVSYLKNSMRINTSEEFQIRQSVSVQVIKSLGGKDSNAYRDKSIRSKAYAQFWSEFKRHFKMARYGDLAKRKLDDAFEFITEWTPDTELRLLIKHANQQLTIEEVTL